MKGAYLEFFFKLDDIYWDHKKGIKKWVNELEKHC